MFLANMMQSIPFISRWHSSLLLQNLTTCRPMSAGVTAISFLAESFIQLTAVFSHDRLINHTWRLSHGAEVLLVFGDRSHFHQISLKEIIPAVVEAYLHSVIWESCHLCHLIFLMCVCLCVWLSLCHPVSVSAMSAHNTVTFNSRV